MTELPMVYHGDPGQRTPEEIAVVDAAIARFTDLFNAIPDHLKGEFLSSILLSVCIGQEDPRGALKQVVSSVLCALDPHLAKPVGHA